MILLVLSEQSVGCNWIEYEVEMALDGEARWGHDHLVPLRVDDAVMQTPQPWAMRLRQRGSIGDFTRWQDHKIYQQQLTELLRHLEEKTT